jgi:DNA-binding NtrC family response regulator
MPSALPPVRVLVVDDDANTCEMLRVFLGTYGSFQVRTLRDPTLVEETLREEDYHLLILDQAMPQMNGMEVLQRVRKFDTDLAVVILTGYPDLDTAVTAVRLGVVDYLRKPFDPEAMRKVIARVLRAKGLARASAAEVAKVIGASIRQIRKEHGMTLMQLSGKAGLSASVLSQIERAESSASITSLHKIASALGSRVRDLFGEL